MIRVFVYGTLKRGHYNHHMLQNAKFLQCAGTVENEYHMGSVGYPLVTEGGSYPVFGEVYEISEEDYTPIQRMERSVGYNEWNVRVEGVDGEWMDVCMFGHTRKVPADYNVVLWRNHLVWAGGGAWREIIGLVDAYVENADLAQK